MKLLMTGWCLYVVGFVLVSASQLTPQLEALLQQLRSAPTSDQAAKELSALAESSPEVKDRLARELPPLIEAGPSDNYRPWRNSVELAGQLRIVEAAAPLARWIGLPSEGTVTMGQYSRLEDKPAAKALARLGDAAIPSVGAVLQRGSPAERKGAVRVLQSINSAEAKDALRAQLAKEPDPEVRRMIRNALGR